MAKVTPSPTPVGVERGVSKEADLGSSRWQSCKSIGKEIRRYLSTLDLRFEDASEEVNFKESLENEVILHGCLAALCGVIVIPVALVPVFAREFSFMFALGDVRSGLLLTWCSTFIVALSYLITSALRLWKGWFKKWNWELYFMISASYYALSLSFANFWHMPLMVGIRPESVWHHDARGTEVFILLALDGLMTCVAMYVPVRACNLWILPVLGVGSYLVLLMAVDSVFPNDRHLTVGALLALTSMASNSAWRNEKSRREKWQALLRVLEQEEVVKSTTDELDATSALAKGLRSVANSLCDVLVKLTSDMKVWGAESGHNAFFEQDMEGRKFTDILEERDITRFNALLNLVSKDHVPACLPVTIRRSQTTSECHLLLVDTGRREPRYLLGIRVESDQAHSMMLPADNYSEVIQSSGMVDYLGLVPSVTRIGQGNNSYNHQMMMQDADFSFTTYPKNAPPPPPQFTPIKARALSVRKLMPRWNLLRDPEACCMFHTNARSLGAVIDHLLTAPCDPLWSTLSGGQCHRCKCMCTEAWQRCVVCGLPNPEFESQQMQQAFQMQQSFQPVGGGIEEDTRIEAPIRPANISSSEAVG